MADEKPDEVDDDALDKVVGSSSSNHWAAKGGTIPNPHGPRPMPKADPMDPAPPPPPMPS